MVKLSATESKIFGRVVFGEALTDKRTVTLQTAELDNVKLKKLQRNCRM